VTGNKVCSLTTLLFSIAALLMSLSSSTRAQTTTSSLTVLNFTDGVDDTPGRITADAAGNAYISAGIKGSGFAVLKYNPVNRLRVIRYKDQAGEFGGQARAVALDKLGNIFAAGDTSIGGRIVSFTPAGVQRWADRFNGTPVAIAVDALGNVYVAGTRETGNFQGEWVIIKYSNDGQTLWEQHHTGTVAESDVRLTDMQLDSAGNPVVLGTTNILAGFHPSTMTTLKLDSHGNTLWVRDFVDAPIVQNNPRGLALDRMDSVYATGATGPFSGVGFTVKYDVNGNRQFVLSGDESGGVAVTIDPAGDVLLIGGIAAQPPALGIQVVSKYHSNGLKVWTTGIPTAGKLLTDSTGSVFVAGSALNSARTDNEYVVSKVSPAGKFLFKKIFAQGQDVTDAAFDGLGNLFVSGTVLNARSQTDILTLKLAKGFTPSTAK
jgi:hypothetical protein